MARRSASPARILVVGGGYVGMYTTLRLLAKLRRGEAEITVVDPRSYMTYQPFLPEAAAGSIQPRHVVVALRRVLKGVTVVTGSVTALDHAQHRATIEPLEGSTFTLDYDHVVLAAGSVSRTLPVPGLADWGTGFKSVEEAIQLRNRVLECMDIAESTRDADVRQRNLHFVVVGGGYAGIECLAELEDMARYASRYYPSIAPEDLRWTLVEASDRILPEVGPEMGLWTLEQLRERGIDCRLGTRLESCVGGRIVLSDGTEFDAETLVWTAGVKPNPVVGFSDLPLTERGSVATRTTLQVEGFDDAWCAGDISAVPDLANPGQFCSPSAQHAVRQSKVLADNLVSVLRGYPARDYEHKHAGSVAGLGLHKGVAHVYGVKVKGWPAWFMHRTYHVSRVPTFSRKMQVIIDWTSSLFFKRETVSLWSMHEPFNAFKDAAGDSAPTATPAAPREPDAR
jgi:NADH:ubiquinone reductase (H+-translocating)